MRPTRVSLLGRRTALLALGLAATTAGEAWAQTSTGTIRGRVTDEAGQPVVSASVVATNPQTGTQRGALTQANGAYLLGGLQPGTYEIRASSIGYAEGSETVRVLVGQTLVLDFQLGTQAVQIEGITVMGDRAAETRTPEVAANVTLEQIDNLPQGNRNFLEFATLAPGVQQRQAGVSAGGTSVSNTNLFVDGATYKSDVLPGGVAGQDPSLARQLPGVGRVLGNPFPQNAVQEFRVITQNYRAEYQKASGAVVTAATRSGTNEISGDLFFYGQNEGLIARNWFQRENDLDVPDFRRSQFGGSIGGPIVRDRIHYFASYEGNLQNTDARVTFEERPGLPALPDSLLRGQGEFLQPLRSHLFFGKLGYQVDDRQDLMFTLNVRNERDERDFGGVVSADGRVNIANDVNTLMLRHTLSGHPYTNQAQASFQRFRWKSVPDRPDLARLEFQEWGVVRGGSTAFQDFVQDRLSLRNDITWTMGSHVLKGGANVDFLRYDVTKRLEDNPVFRFHPSRPGGFESPFEATLQVGDPDLTTTNWQLGAYVQTDWTVTPRLTLNLGVRWDYEHDWLNNDFVTPAWVQDSIRSFTSEFPYFDPGDYLTDGSDRPRFLGAIQPRVGFSYDLSRTNRSVIYGGGGLFYDRINYNTLLDEKYKAQRPRYRFGFVPAGMEPGPGEIEWSPQYFSRDALLQLVASGQAGAPEVFLIRNDQRPPSSVHASLGYRHVFGGFTGSVTGTAVNGRDYLRWIWGHRNPQDNELLWGNRGMAAVLLSTDEGKSWYRALLFSLSRPMTDYTRWGGDLTYTLSKTEINTYQDVEDPFALDYLPGDPVLGFRRVPGRFDERHRVVLNVVSRLPLDVRMSTITTLGSGFPFTLSTGCQGPWDFDDPNGFCATQGFQRPDNFIPSFLATPPGEGARSERPEGKWFGPFGKWAYRNVDLRLQKDFRYRGQSVGVSADVLNVFDFTNFNYENFEYNLRWDTNQGDGPINPRHPRHEFGTFDSRRLQLGVKYAF